MYCGKLKVLADPLWNQDYFQRDWGFSCFPDCDFYEDLWTSKTPLQRVHNFLK